MARETIVGRIQATVRDWREAKRIQKLWVSDPGRALEESTISTLSGNVNVRRRWDRRQPPEVTVGNVTVGRVPPTTRRQLINDLFDVVERDL